jgi:N-methylhydantoinase A
LPGPACYGRGGTEPTVTDANLYLDRVNAEYFLGGAMRLHPDRSAEALQRLGTEVGMPPEPLASGILDVVNARMADLMRQITIGRGLDPREFTLIAFGGAGPMHAVFLAEELGIGTVLVPYSPGTFSAQGMLSADISHDLVRPFFARLDRVDVHQLEALVSEMRSEGGEMLAEDGVATPDRRFKFNVDMRYVGQEHSLTLPFKRLDEALAKRFHRTYRRTFGHSNSKELVEVVSIRMTAIGVNRRSTRSQLVPVGEGQPYAYREVFFAGRRVTTPRYRREDLQAGQEVAGPLVVDEASCTTVVPDNWLLEVDNSGPLRLTREG